MSQDVKTKPHSYRILIDYGDANPEHTTMSSSAIVI